MNDRFQIVGARPLPEAVPTKSRHSLRGKPVVSTVILSLIVLGCLFCELIMTKDPKYLDLAHCSTAPCREFLFGTDTMGRDIFSMIWYGGRLSLFIGVGSTVISTLLAILFGAVSGLAPKWLDALLMRLTEILLSVPNLLLVIFLQAIIGTPSARGALRSSSASRAGRASPRSCAPRCSSCARASMSSRPSAWAVAFSTFCGVISHRISSRPSSSWW